VRPLRPLVALDVSLSWLRAADTSAWERTRRRAMAAGGDSVLLVGHDVRTGTPPSVPTDTALQLGTAVERAQLAGRPLHFFSDGESDMNAAQLAGRLPAGSRVIVEAVTRRPDAAVVGLEAPAAAIAGDTLRLRVHIAAGETAPATVSLTASVDGRPAARRVLEPLASWDVRIETVSLVLPPGPRDAEIAVALDSPDDGEPRNDSAWRVVRRGERTTALAVSTAPDFDFREMVRVLRGSLSLPTLARFRIAPGRWVDDAGRPVAEARVARELAGAQVVLLHGDTALFGEPRSAVRGALVLVPPPADETEWYLRSALPSPLATVLETLPFDSLPPVAVGAPGPGVPLFQASGPVQATRTVGTLQDSTRRVIIVPVRGTFRWALRGGAAADAFATLWGSIFAALAERPGTAFPAAGVRLAPSELHPRPPVLRSGALGEADVGTGRTALRGSVWPYLLLVIFLCTEWVLRRRAGLR
jgi:hypothetical protein